MVEGPTVVAAGAAAGEGEGAGTDVVAKGEG